jgi:hypothetical protein
LPSGYDGKEKSAMCFGQQIVFTGFEREVFPQAELVPESCCWSTVLIKIVIRVRLPTDA